MSVPVAGTWRVRIQTSRIFGRWATEVLGFLTRKMADWKARLSSWKDVAATLQAGATILALAVGGYWFYTQRADKPRLKIEHKILSRKISQTEYTFLSVDILLTNTGNVAVKVGQEVTDVFQVDPLLKDDRDLLAKDPQALKGRGTRLSLIRVAHGHRDWGRETQMRIEPGEADQIHREFLIRRGPQVIRVYSTIENPKGSPLVWDCTTIFDINTLNP